MTRVIPALLTLLLTTHHARATSRQMLPNTASRGGPERTAGNEPSGVPQIIKGIHTTAYPAVGHVAIWNPTGVTSCTGTLVGPFSVLIAANCVDDGPMTIRARFVAIGSAATSVDVVGFTMHPQYRFPYADLAVLRLASPVVGITPAKLARRKPAIGKSVTLVGYGEDEVTNLG